MSTPLKTIRTALIGYGFAGRDIHSPLLRSVPGIELALIATSRVDEVRKRLPGVAISADPQAAATHPDIDLVVIASPNESHCPLASAALRAGKHVVIDKPFSITLDEARATVALAQQCGRLLSIFHNRRWDSEYLATKDILASGVLGKVTHHESHIDRYRPIVRQRWREQPGPGAGLWFDLGPHLIDQSLQLLGLPEGVTARIVTSRPGGLTDDWAHVLLHYPGGVEIVLHASMLVAGGSSRCILHGTQGSWYKFGADVQEPQMIAGMMPGDPGFGVDPDPGILYDANGQRKEIPVPAADQSMYYAGVRDSILEGAPLPVTAIQGLATQAVLEASFQSSKEGRTLPIPLTEAERAAFTFSGF